MDSDQASVHAARRTQTEIISILRSYQNSQLTVATFCALNGINKGTFYTWKKRYRDMMIKKADEGAFVRLAVIAGHDAAALFAEVNGIRLYQPVSPEFLKALQS